MLQALIDFIAANILYLTLHLNNYGAFPPPLKPSEEKMYFERLKNGDEEARKILIKHNLRLVAHIIKKYYSGCAEQDDLISVGTIGLIKGINSFNPDRGIKLATYAARCIENEVFMYFRQERKGMQDISLSEPVETDGEGNPLTLMEIIKVDDTIVDDIDIKLKEKMLKKFVEDIPNERDKTIIILRYGLNGGKPMTQKEVAKQLNISRSYVSRIEKRVLKYLNRKFETETCI
ncbi:MAG: RNA polymerase sporulation sigma factor SigK [Clostridiales bacterium]|jgi:RNA polymerase sporulation-specific sigma factor|nr:RNA polymerase sporulation sigma factor SigK [Clostridiales bacterium]HOA33439.1 RNA polymerase sporulation sigma factor SigK [Clostridiales bacterium]HOJ36232.1 RNA polymerase sporulation sigma factor SigK [Clostridiales bacterium]HOL79616.1 RNA polymerase sporulation sigma factor SigK [Clostridiales bacterium]HPP67791.1 RNA polymerase sporulation sigma factor SigK [Clostridiales bacterium]